jgi:predicted component of type VI protein secretion system
MRVSLRLLNEKSGIREIPVDVKQFMLGRSLDCELQIPSLLVSRHHCMLTVGDGEVFVHDLESTNGTLVNGQPLVGKRLLRDGDRLFVASAMFEICIRPASKIESGINLLSRAISQALLWSKSDTETDHGRISL